MMKLARWQHNLEAHETLMAAQSRWPQNRDDHILDDNTIMMSTESNQISAHNKKWNHGNNQDEDTIEMIFYLMKNHKMEMIRPNKKTITTRRNDGDKREMTG